MEGLGEIPHQITLVILGPFQDEAGFLDGASQRQHAELRVSEVNRSLLVSDEVSGVAGSLAAGSEARSLGK